MNMAWFSFIEGVTVRSQCIDEAEVQEYRGEIFVASEFRRHNVVMKENTDVFFYSVLIVYVLLLRDIAFTANEC